MLAYTATLLARLTRFTSASMRLLKFFYFFSWVDNLERGNRQKPTQKQYQANVFNQLIGGDNTKCDSTG